MNKKGFHYKPLSIIFLSLVYFLSPVAKTLFFMWFYKLGFIEIISPIIKNYVWWKKLTFFVFPLLAGFAIYKVKNWSLYLFIFCELAMFAGNLHYVLWLKSVNFEQMIFFYYFFTGSTFIITLYFLVPNIRLAYLDPKVRWWESAPRYNMQTPCTLNLDDRENFNGQIKNVSLTGFFISTTKQLKEHAIVNINFSYEDFHLELKAEVIYIKPKDGEKGLGLKSIIEDRQTKSTLKKLIKLLDRKGLSRRPKKRFLFN